MKVWLNGALLDAAAARIDPADRGLLLGDGVFETLPVDHGRPHHLARHLRRLREGAAALAIGCPYEDSALAGALAALAAANAPGQAVARMTLTRGPGGRGVLPATGAAPTLLLTVQKRAEMPAAVSAVLAEGTRRNEFSPLSRIKSLNYGDAILARQEAAARGADEAILRNTRGTVAEASAANLFLLRDGALWTPPVADGALPGISRALLMERLGAREASLEAADLLRAEALLLTSSLGVRMVTALDGTVLPQRRDIFRAAQQALEA